jgi:hypothetical protein
MVNGRPPEPPDTATSSPVMTRASAAATPCGMGARTSSTSGTTCTAARCRNAARTAASPCLRRRSAVCTRRGLSHPWIHSANEAPTGARASTRQPVSLSRPSAADSRRTSLSTNGSCLACSAARQSVGRRRRIRWSVRGRRRTRLREHRPRRRRCRPHDRSGQDQLHRPSDNPDQEWLAAPAVRIGGRRAR